MDLLTYGSLSDTITSESDLLHDVWGFIKKSFAKSVINVNSYVIRDLEECQMYMSI